MSTRGIFKSKVNNNVQVNMTGSGINLTIIYEHTKSITKCVIQTIQMYRSLNIYIWKIKDVIVRFAKINLADARVSLLGCSKQTSSMNGCTCWHEMTIFWVGQMLKLSTLISNYRSPATRIFKFLFRLCSWEGESSNPLRFRAYTSRCCLWNRIHKASNQKVNLKLLVWFNNLFI